MSGRRTHYFPIDKLAIHRPEELPARYFEWDLNCHVAKAFRGSVRLKRVGRE